MWIVIGLIIDNIFMLLTVIAASLLIPDLGEWGDTSVGIPIRMVVFFIIGAICITCDIIKRNKEDSEGV